MIVFFCVTLWIALCSDITQGVDYGDGNLHELRVVQDVWIENPNTNYNSYPWLIVGKLTGYPKKRSLIQFEPITSSQCPLQKLRWAKMYLHFQYAHIAGGQTIQQTPYISRPLQVHRVKKEWKEAEATTTRRTNGNTNLWTQSYLDLNNDDTEATPQDCPTTIYTRYPKGNFVEFDVTRAVKSWISGQANYGLLIWATDEDVDGRGIRFASNAEEDSTKHALMHVMCDY